MTRTPTPEEIQAFRDGWTLADTMGLQGRRVEAGLTSLFRYLEATETPVPDPPPLAVGDRVRGKYGARSIYGAAIGGQVGEVESVDTRAGRERDHIVVRLDGTGTTRVVHPRDLERIP